MYRSFIVSFAFLVPTFSSPMDFFKPSREVCLAAVGGLVIGGAIIGCGLVYVCRSNPNYIPRRASFKNEILKDEQLKKMYITQNDSKQKIDYNAVLSTLKRHSNPQIEIQNMVGSILQSNMLPQMMQQMMTPDIIKTFHNVMHCAHNAPPDKID